MGFLNALPRGFYLVWVKYYPFVIRYNANACNANVYNAIIKLWNLVYALIGIMNNFDKVSKWAE